MTDVTRETPAPAGQPSISACFPAYNDGGTIGSVVVSAILTLRGLTDDFEVIVCNDGSADYTPQVLEELAAVYPAVTVIHHPRNMGYGSALRSAFARASKDLVFYTDGDAQYDVRELACLMDKMSSEVDVVNGYKISRNDPLHRIVIGRVYHHLMRILFGFRIRDVDCDFRLMRRGHLQALSLESTDGTLPLELVKKLTDTGARFVETPVHHFHRVYGQSQFFNLRRLLRVVRDIVRMWFKLVVRPTHASATRVPSPE